MNPLMPLTLRIARWFPLLCLGFHGVLLAGLAPGDRVQITLRGVGPEEQTKVNGMYRVRESGGIRLPLLDHPVPASGMSPDDFARKAEKAYIDAGIYARPAIEVEAVEGGDQQGEAVISVGGQVRRAGQTPYRKNMTVIQALDAAGGRNDFGGRNLLLIRMGKQYCLDFKQLKHKGIALEPGDSIQVEQKGAVIDRWKGNDENVAPLLD